MHDMAKLLDNSNTKLATEVRDLKAELASNKEDLTHSLQIFDKERKVIIAKHDQEIASLKQQWKDDQEMYNKEIKLKDLIIESLNKTIQKMTEEIKVIKSVLKSPHLYSKLNEYATRQLSFEKLREGIDQNKSVDNKDNYKMFDKLDIEDYTSTTIQSINEKYNGNMYAFYPI